MKQEILIVEDDVQVAEGLHDILSGYGYQIFTADNAKSALECMDRQNIRLIILDVCLNGESGYDICRTVRRKSDVPILFLTACSSEVEVVRGFTAGGDDYLVKPFRMQELLVRMQALIRRYVPDIKELYRSGELAINFEGWQLWRLADQGKKIPIEVTPIEWKMLLLLIKKYPHTVSRRQLLYEIWDKDAAFVEENTLNVNISRIREKLGTYGDDSYIATIRGKGYRWNVPIQRNG